MKKNTKKVSQTAESIALTQEMINPYAAFSSSSMMVIVKKDLFGSGDEMGSSPAGPGGW